ncbi:serine hydrolase domain-containing protein [Roseiconus sp. JC912]
MLDRRTILAAMLGGTASLIHAEQPNPDGINERIETLVREAIAKGDLPGAVVCCAGTEQVYYQATFGNRWLTPTKVPMSAETIFDLASITKSVATATSVALLYQDKKIDPNAPVCQYMPEFNGNGKQKITIQQCLLHTSGLTPDNALADYLEGPDIAWQKICNLGLRSKPGEKFAYSDVGFIVLGQLIKRVSGVEVDRFAAKAIFEPLSMQDTMFNPPEALRSRIAPTENEGDEWICARVHDPRSFKMGGVAGHAGLFSSAGDLVKFGRDMLAASKGQSKIFDQATFDWMITPHPVPEQLPRGTRAMGWDHQSPYSRNRGESFSKRAFGHGGFTGTVLWIDPVKELVFVFLSSRLYPDGKGSVNTLAGQIATELGNEFGEVR